MKPLEKEICYLSNQVYKFYYEIAKKELDGEGEDTFELAYDYTYNTLSSAAITLGELHNDKLLLYALDVSAMLVVWTQSGKMELWEYLSSKMKEKFGYTLAIGLINDKTKLSDYDNASFIYSFTKPYVEDGHNLILEEVMTWEDAFDLED
jgi:hypothetical protein